MTDAATVYSPGRWQASKPNCDREISISALSPHGRLIIAMVFELWNYDEGHTRRDAYARLIAAAPTMAEYVSSSASAGCSTAKQIMESIDASPARTREDGRE